MVPQGPMPPIYKNTQPIEEKKKIKSKKTNLEASHVFVFRKKSFVFKTKAEMTAIPSRPKLKTFLLLYFNN